MTEYHIAKRQSPSMYAWSWKENALQGIDRLAPFAHPTVRKIIVTGSVEIGKQLAELADRHMKRTTMELGGHAPVLVFDDVDAEAAACALAANKLCNAVQGCISLTRFFVQAGIHDRFLSELASAFETVRVGD